QQGMAVDAIIGMPDILPPDNFIRELIGIGQFWKLAMTVYRQYQKDKRRYCCGTSSKKASLSFIHGGPPLHANSVPMTDSDIACINNTNQQQEQHGVAHGLEQFIECCGSHNRLHIDYYLFQISRCD